MEVINLLHKLNKECYNKGTFDFSPWSLESFDFKDASLSWAYCYDNDTTGKELCSNCKKHLTQFLSEKKRKAKEKRDLIIAVKKLTAEVEQLKNYKSGSLISSDS